MQQVTVKHHERPPFWRNVTILKWIAQIGVAGGILAILFILGRQAAENFSRSGITFGFEWASRPPGITIREGIDTNPDSGARALVVGLINTLRVSVSGIVAATIIGTIIGIARLSRNWIVSKAATVYVETIRNIPLLVQIFFWSALAIGLKALELPEGVTREEFWFKATNKGFALAWVFPSVGFYQWLVFVIAGVIAGRYVYRWRKRVFEETGQEAYAFTWAFATVVVFAAIGWFLHPLFGFLGSVFRGIASLIDAIPSIGFSIAIAAAGILGAAWWIRNFFESRRTPAGFGKLTDDDWFRVIFAGVAGLAIAFVAFWIGEAKVATTLGDRKALVELLEIGIVNIFDWLAAKFHGMSGAPLVFQKPFVEIRGAGFTQFGNEGILVTPPFFAVWTGVTLYTAAFIAEIVRGGILAVPKGQTEAAQALGFKRSQYLRLIILPQAFRIILPPMGNQYLNLAKNTSLGLAVAFADIVAVGFTLINQTGQALPIVLVWMAFFLTVSLTISAIVNYYNRKLKLVER